MDLKVNVYKGNEVIKTVEAKTVDIRFGTVRKLMELTKVERIDNTYGLLSAVVDAWDDIKVVLSDIFPELSEEDMDNIKLSELVPVVMQILKESFAKVLTIPSDSKNGKAE